MVGSIGSKLSFSQNSLPHSGNNVSRDDLLNHFKDCLEFLLLPSRGISTLFAWVELLPINAKLLDHLAHQRVGIKKVNATFGLPKFFIKQLKLYQACFSLRNDLMQGCDLGNVVQDVKKIFFSLLGLAISAMKMPLMLDKTNVIDLSQISRRLPDVLEKGATLLSFGASCMHLVEGSWVLGSFLSECQSSKQHSLKEILLSSKAVKLEVKLVSSAVKATSAFISAAALFFGWYLSPLVLIGTSTLSFATALTSQMVDHENPFLGYKPLFPISQEVPSLPA